MIIKCVLLAVIGLGAGAVTAAGYFAVIAVVGVITRFANYSGTASKIRFYEIMLCTGGIIGNILLVFNPAIRLWGGVGAVVGILVGIFSGCFLLSLAEMVKGLPVFMRKSNIKKGISAIIISLAIGKTLGSIFYFCCYLSQK